MKKTNLDYSVIDKLGLALPPVGVYFDLFRPADVPPLDMGVEKSLCELLRYAQEINSPFCFSKDNKETCVGKIMVGMEQFPPSAESGQIGERLGVFNAPRCNARLYYSVKRLTAGTVNYVSFVPYGSITRDPDVLVFSGTPSQMEPVMRAATYSTGVTYKSQSTAVMGCSWFLVNPYMTGEINFVVPAFIHGPHGRQLWDENTIVVSVPYQWVPTVIQNLHEMPLHLSGHEGKEKYYAEFNGILADLDEELKHI